MACSELIGISPKAKKILVARKKLTGKPFSKLIDEYVGVPRFTKVNKKGNFADIPEYLRVSLAIGIFLLIVVMIVGGFNAEIQSSTNPVVTNITKELSQNAFDSFSGLDLVVPALLLAFIIFSVMAARLIPSSPKFIIISILALIIIPFGGIIVENIWAAFSSKISYLSSFPMTNFLLSNSVIVLVIYSFLVAVALITKDERIGFNG